MKKRILIIEDEKHIANGLKFNLDAEGFVTEIAGDGESGLEMLRRAGKRFDALVLDIMLPGIKGFEVASSLRSGGDFTPILMLTARGSSEDVLLGFESGADDYLAKPFELEIFLARLKGLLRRHDWQTRESAGEAEENREIIQIAGKKIDLDNLEIRRGDEVIRLTLMEANLLGYLVSRAGNAVSRKEILENVWDLHEDTDTRAIDNFIVRLRRYLEEDPSKPRVLETVRGVGYRCNPG